MASHFHDWIDYQGVAFSIVTRMGSDINISDFWGKTVLHILRLADVPECSVSEK